MDLKKLYIKIDTPGCVSQLEFMCLYIDEHEGTSNAATCNSLWRVRDASAERFYPSGKIAEQGKELGVWKSDTPRGTLSLTSFGKSVVVNVKARLTGEPAFNHAAWKKERVRLKEEKAKAAGLRPTTGEMIYLRKNAEMAEHVGHVIDVNGAKITIIKLKDRPTYYWGRNQRAKVKKTIEKKPYAVIGLHTAPDVTHYPRRNETFTLIMLKGQMVAVHPKALMKMRPGGQGLNKRKKTDGKEEGKTD